MKGWRIFFVIAGCFNLLGGAIGFLTIERSFVDQGLPAPIYPFAFQILFVAVMIFGIAYLMVARDPVRYRHLVVLGLLTKIAGFVLTLWAIHTGQLPPSSWWQPVVNDLIWAVGFSAFLWRTRRRG